MLSPRVPASRLSLAHTRSGHSGGVPVAGKNRQHIKPPGRVLRADGAGAARSGAKPACYPDSARPRRRGTRRPQHPVAARLNEGMSRTGDLNSGEPLSENIFCQYRRSPHMGPDGRRRPHVGGAAAGHVSLATMRAPSLPGRSLPPGHIPGARSWRGSPAAARLPRLVARGYLPDLPGRHHPSHLSTTDPCP